MLMTKRKPATVGEILTEEFMQPLGLTQGALAEAMGVQRKHVNELCNDRRNVTAATALILARVFGNSPDFWLNVQRRTDLWEAMHSPRDRKRIERAQDGQIVGVAEMADAEELAGDLGQAGAERDVEMLERHLAELIGVMARRHQHGRERRRIVLRLLAP